MPRAVVFDLDGVLVDSEPVWEQVRRGLVEERGAAWPAEAQRRLMGMNTREWSAYLSSLGIGLSPRQTARLVIGRMRRAYSEQPPYLPGALAALTRLGARWPLGLASASPRELIDVLLARPELAGRFTAAVSADEVTTGKPAPDVYLTAADRLGAAPTECVAVEDSSNGVLAAVAAGMAVIAIPHLRYSLTAEARAHAGHLLTTLDELTIALLAA